MKSAEINSKIIDGYMKLLEGLNRNHKLILISKLTQSINSKVNDSKRKKFLKAFGAWDDNDSADKLINDIRRSRKFNRKIEKL